MRSLINRIKKLAIEFPAESYRWDLPSNCPIAIPKKIASAYHKNVFLKENLWRKLNFDRSLDTHYWIIQDWGRIGSFKRTDKNNLRLRALPAQLKNDKLTKSSFDCISSLSKVASFSEPEKYAIYDSRAIYSLNWLTFIEARNDLKLFPQPNGRSTELAKFDTSTIFRLSGRQLDWHSHKTAYHRYCQLISELSMRVYGKKGKPYQMEMLLFMLAPHWVPQHISASVKVEINTQS